MDQTDNVGSSPVAVLRRTSTEPGKASFKLKTPDMIHFASTAATLARDISNMSACPPAAAAASIVLMILETIQEVRANHDACARLARRCVSILGDLDLQMTGRWGSAPPLLIKNLERFRETLLNIHKYIAMFVDMKWTVRFIKKSMIEDTLVDLNALLTDASRSFQMSTLINIHHVVSSRTQTKNDSECTDVHDEEDTSAQTVDLFLDPDKCLSFRHEPEFNYHDFVELIDDQDETWAQHSRQYRLSDIKMGTYGRVVEGFGWWNSVAEADDAAGRNVLIKRYDQGAGMQRKWLSDLSFLRRLYHPSLPQLFGSSLKNSPMPFILLANVSLEVPRDAILNSLRATKSVKKSSYLVLHFFHQLQSVVMYLSESFNISPPRIQGFLDDSAIGVDHDDLVLSLPEQSNGCVSVFRNHGMLETMRVMCLKMLPRTFGRSTLHQDDDILHELLVSTRLLIWTHETAKSQQSEKYVPPSPDDDECMCELSERPWNDHPTPRWAELCCDVHEKDMEVWDFGYVPQGKDMESFVKLGNLVKDELATYPEDESVSAVQYISNSTHSVDLPYTGLPYRVACWTLSVPQTSCVKGAVTHTACGSEKDAWTYLIQAGQLLADEFEIPLCELRILTSVERKIDFDISSFEAEATWDDPPRTMYLFTAQDRERWPYLSSTPSRVSSGKLVPILQPEWTCTLKWRTNAVQSVALTRSGILSSSPILEESLSMPL